MKVVYFTVTNDLVSDQRMHRICTSLAENQYEVHLVGRKGRKLNADFPFKTHRLFCFFKKGKFFYLEFHLRLLLFLFFKKMDALCSCDTDTLLVGAIMKRFKKLPLIYDAHEFYSETSGLHHREKEKKAWKALEDRLIPKADLCYSVAPKLAEIMEKEFNTPFYVVRNLPVLEKECTSERNFDTKTILYQGALNRGRGLKALIEAMPDLHAKLIIAGDGPLKEELEALTRMLKLESKVEFTGFLPPAELKELTKKCWIGINLLENLGLSYYYSLANKFFDYVQAEKPQICINFPEYQELNRVYHVAILTDDLHPKSIKAAVNELKDNTKYDRLKTNTQKAKQELCWENEEKILLKFYSDFFLKVVEGSKVP